MPFPTQYEIDRTLVVMAIDHALLNFGKDVYDKVVKKLNEDGFTIVDCFDHPEYLNKILKDLFGSSYTKIIHSIHIWLDDSSSNQLISDFLVAVRKS